MYCRFSGEINQSLKSLILHNCITDSSDLSMIARIVSDRRLHKLDISHSSNITGNLSVLLCQNFRSLNSLILCDCGLNSQDLCSLAQASVKGRLPKLKHLDISENRRICITDLFSSSCKWGQLLELNIVGIGYNWKHSRGLGFPRLQKLSISQLHILNFSPYTC